MALPWLEDDVWWPNCWAQISRWKPYPCPWGVCWTKKWKIDNRVRKMGHFEIAFYFSLSIWVLMFIFMISYMRITCFYRLAVYFSNNWMIRWKKYMKYHDWKKTTNPFLPLFQIPNCFSSSHAAYTNLYKAWFLFFID